MSKEKSNQSMDVNPYSRLASLPIHSENIFHFPKGLPAFEHLKEFAFAHKPDTSPFIFMHALDPSDISFVCIDPFSICPTYKPRISHADTSFLHLENSSDLLLLSIVTVNSDVKKITTNLQGPIAINIQACMAKQIICEGNHYPVRYNIWDSLNDLKMTSKKAAEEKKTVMIN